MGGVSLIIIDIVLSGYVLSVLWAWFVASTFGLPALSFPNAAGIYLIVQLTTRGFEGFILEDLSETLNRDFFVTFVKSLVTVMFFPCLILSVGLVVYLYM